MKNMNKLIFASTLLVVLISLLGCSEKEESTIKDRASTVNTTLSVTENTTEETVNLPSNGDHELLIDPSKFRGFNLQSKILVGDWVNDDADEWAFIFMAKEGFNFARIPMEVQALYSDENYTNWNNDALLEIDRIIALGQKYGIHILLDLHTLPGIRPSELPDSDSNFNSEQRLAIWKDIFEVLSLRYKDIPSTDLSYNLINEPYQMDNEEYFAAIGQVRDVIRKVDKTKLLFIDPNHWTDQTLNDLADLGDPYLVASPHFYQPFLVTHYKAEWVAGADTFPTPEYPSVDFNGYLYGDTHPTLKQPMTIKGQFSKGSTLKIRLNDISNYVDLSINTDKESLYHNPFQTNDDPSIWKVINFNEEWQIYQNKYDRDIKMVLTEDANEITIQLLSGDWLTISAITIENPNWKESLKVTATSFDWGEMTPNLSVTELGTLDFDASSRVINKAYLYEHYFKQWVDFKKTTTIPVVACEFGVYNKTDHDTSLKVLEDDLSLFKENNIGFALWNFSGAFGIFDSGRDDVEYENYNGHLLDRAMLELLKKY